MAQNIASDPSLPGSAIRRAPAAKAWQVGQEVLAFIRLNSFVMSG
jgi:hypothetical protein